MADRTPRFEARQRLFVALDTPNLGQARDLVRGLAGHVGGFKIGLELFGVGGPDLVREVGAHGKVFLDLKLHDIPNTVAGAAAAIARLGVSYFTVHASGGTEMIRRGVEAARQAARDAGLPLPTALAVTVLTSHDETTLAEIGLVGPCRSAVTRLTALARDAGAGGLVCSAQEITAAREVFDGAVIVVPGIRSAMGPRIVRDDQSRTASPGDVVRLGGDLLVVGRPITRASDPARAADALVGEIADAEGDAPS